jgi:hypothetical protein
MELDKIIAYHYTNEENLRYIYDGTMYGRKGLISIKRFISLGKGHNLPDEAFDGVVQALLEPEPKSWIKNPEFPALWGYLMHDICRRDKVILLSFEIMPQDKAYVVERAHVEQELYREFKTGKAPTKKQKEKAYSEYWNSRVPVFQYRGNYKLPQLAIWTTIICDRLKIEWVKQTKDIWQRCLDNKWIA